ncbi:Bikaverin cluster transcription factor bik5 [Penicillium rolfsii]|nr:Bikaverin cluster transcription factor bik5 [Penicillium rolfsii]
MDSQFQGLSPETQNSPADDNTSKASEGSTGPSLTRPHQHIRSCLFCRSRKVKCDRQKPCANCIRTGAECVYPSGPGRAPKRPRRPLDKRVLDRLADLEALVRRLDATEAGSQPARGSTPTNLTADPTTEPKDGSNQIEQQFGRLVIDNTRSCYVSNILWASLGDEIEELRDLLCEEASEDEDFDTATVSSVADTTTSLGSNAAIMGFQALAQSLRAYHPPLSQSVALFEIFKHSVAPLVHIFHMPTLVASYWDAVASPESLDRNTEALLFAIYYSTVISMEPQQCEQVLGFSRAAAVKHYQFAVEQAMARANLLNTQSVVLIQAVVLFLSALRNEDASRTAWSMTALIFHIAQAMGLHRDGSSFGLRPMETEIRRRLWWHICLLDIRSSEYHGCEPIVHESMFDTRMPLNIDDSDLTPDMTVPPPEREGSTEMTFCLIRCEVMRIAWKTGYVPPGMRRPGQPAEGASLPERAALAKDLQQRLEERYLKHCDTSSPFFQVCVTVARLIIARTWLVVHYPLLQKNDGATLPSPIRDQLFTISIKVLELSYQLLTSPALTQWTWHSKTHVQWHAVAFVLSEICSRPPSQDCDRAWEYAQTVYNRWKMKEHKGNLWRPIKRLMAKAQYVREIQKKKNAPAKPHWRVAGISAVIPSDPSAEHFPSNSSDTKAPVSPESIGGTTGGLIDPDWVMSTESLEPFLDNLNRADLPDPSLGYSYPMCADFNMTNFDGNAMDMAFGMIGFIP